MEMPQNNNYIDELEIRKALCILREPGELFEIRVIGKSKNQQLVGYFTDINLMISELKRLDLRGANVYTVLNRIKPECYGREARDRFVAHADATSDKDIESRTWILIDLDPNRAKGTSSTDEQIALAKQKANEIYRFLENHGFSKPVTALSGNGCHLLYKVNLQNSDDRTEMVKTLLQTLSICFSDENIQVDTSTFNAARICKLYGTLAQKGSSTERQPHRMSRVNTIPGGGDVRTTKAAIIQKVCDIFPRTPDSPQKYNNYNGADFDLDGWLSKYGIVFDKEPHTDGVRYRLEHCPFDENHKGKDAMIFRYRNGAIGFHCFHDSCQGKTWRDVRMLYEPDAYERRDDYYERQMYRQFNRNMPPKPKPIVETPDVPIFESAKYILSKPTPDETYIKSGISKIDRSMTGLRKGCVTLMSGLRSSGKSTLLSQIVLNAVNEGNNVAVYSGELTDSNFMKWVYLQAAGKNRVEVSKRYANQYYVPRKYIEKIAEWLDGRFWLYNNEYGNEYTAVMEQFEKAISEKKLDLLVLDNLMAFDIKSLSQDKYEAQKEFVLSLVRLAKQYNVHILFVAHPRKAMGFLRLQDVSGTNDLVNAVDNAIIVHRNNKDFRRLSKEMFQWKDTDEIYNASNVVEVAKDRDGGTQDLFVPLWFETESRRMRNDEGEYIRYGWELEHDDAEEKPQVASKEPEKQTIPDDFVSVESSNYDEIPFD